MRKSLFINGLLGALCLIGIGNPAYSGTIVPQEYSSFVCVEMVNGTTYRVLKASSTAPVEALELEVWTHESLRSSALYQVSSARREGDMVLVIEGIEMDPTFGFESKRLKLRMATTVGVNRSYLEEPEAGAFYCEFR